MVDPSDFTGATFAVGTVTGLRAFNIEHDTLTSPQQYYVWTPGENEAQCWMGHRPGTHRCACGFYAYYDGSNEYLRADRIAAIVEGYGCVTYGPRGFRSEKMRIVALIERGVAKRREPGWVIQWAMPIYWAVTATVWATQQKWITASVCALVMLVFLLLFNTTLNTMTLGLFHRKTLKKMGEFYGVPVYGSQRHALKNHPLTAPQELPE